ncbi:MAG: hypothetical protein ACPGMR_03455 [Pontibacterium sp.]
MKNEYGLDVSYFEGKLNQIVRDVRNYTPDELARALARLSVAADESVINEKEFKKEETGTHFWIDIDDVARRLPIEMLPKPQTWPSLLTTISRLKTERNNLLEEVEELKEELVVRSERFDT